MNDALKVLETNNLYRHLILFKLYVESEGNINYVSKLLRRNITELFGTDFNYSR